MIRRNVLIGNASRDELLAFCEWNDRDGHYEQLKHLTALAILGYVIQRCGVCEGYKS